MGVLFEARGLIKRYGHVVALGGAQDAAKVAGIEFSSQGASEWDVAKQIQIVDATRAVMVVGYDTSDPIVEALKNGAAD